MKTTIHTGDCRDVMRSMEPDSFTAIVSDPPYGLSFMGKEWDHGVPGVEFWVEALRVLKPGGMLLAFGGSRTYHRLTCAIEDAGFQIRDCLSWLYGSGFPKSLDISKAIDKAAGAERVASGPGKYADRGRANREGIYGDAPSSALEIETDPATDAARTWHGYGTALKPAWEPIVLAMKPMAGTFAHNAQEHGVAGVNVDGCRVAADWENDPSRRGFGSGFHRDGKYSDRGAVGYGSRDNTWSPQDKGRFPANVLLDQESAALLDKQTGTLTSGSLSAEQQVRGGYSGSKSCYGDAKKGGSGEYASSSGGASRFFYTSKAGSAERHGSNGAGGRATTNTHPTLKPLDLMQWLCRLVKMPEGTRILDPFCGSGTTLLAAAREGIDSVGIELDPVHVKIARARFVEDAPMFNRCEVVPLANP